MTKSTRRIAVTRNLFRLGTVLRRIASDRTRLLSLVEQAMLSGANFLSLLLLARSLDANTFGTFSFAWLILLFVVNLQRSAVVVPFVIHTADSTVLHQEGHAWRLLNHWTAALAAAALGIVALLLPLFDAPMWMVTAFLIAAGCVFPSFEYEFRRRWLIQNNRLGPVVGAAGLYFTLYLLGVGVAAATHSLLAAALGFACANLGAGLLCMFLTPRQKKPADPIAFLPFLRRFRHFIGWSVASNLAYNGYSHMPPLILGVIAGPAPVALFQAMRNFTQPLSTAATAVDNFDKPRAARALAVQGIDGLRRALAHTTAALVILTLPYLLLLVVAGDPLVHLVYGPRYGDPSHTLRWFAAVHLTVLMVYPVETALFLLRRPDLLFLGRIGSAVVGIGLCLLLVPTWGLGGAMAGITGGMVFSGLGAAFLLFREKPWTTLKS